MPKQTYYKTLILSGDVPLIQINILQKMIDFKKECLILTADLDNPFGYGRIIKNRKLKIVKIK